MRPSWPDASEVSWASSSLEGCVFEKAAPLVDFRLPLSELRRAGIEESVLFVAPGAADEDGADRRPAWSAAGDEEDLEPTLASSRTPLPAAPPLVAREAREGSMLSTPGSHWRILPQRLAQAESAEPAAPPADLPVLRIDRRRARRRISADAAVDALLGGSTAGSATRFGVALAALFAVLAVKSVGERAPAIADLALMGELPARAAPDLARVPVVRLADAPAAAPEPPPLRARVLARSIAPRVEAPLVAPAPHAEVPRALVTPAPRAPARVHARVASDGTRPTDVPHRFGLPALPGSPALAERGGPPRARAVIARL